MSRRADELPVLSARTATLFTIGRAFVGGPSAVAAVIVAAFLLGFWGFRVIPQEQVGVGDALYRSLQLFNTDFTAPATGTPWQLELARFLAPLAIAYAALVAVATIAREQFQRLSTRWFAHGHVLIVGLGERGSRLARELRRTHHIVAIDSDATNGTARALRAQGTTVLIGDGRGRELLHTARAERAREVIVLTADDSTNLEVAAALQDLEPARSTTHHVAIEDAALWTALHRVSIDPRARRRRIEFINLPDRIAAVLLSAATNVRAEDEDFDAIVIQGSGSVAARLVVRLLRSEQFASVEAIWLSPQDAEQVRSILRSSDAWALEPGTIREWSGDAPPGCSLAFVCGYSEAGALAEAVGLRRRLGPGPQIVVEAPDRDIGEALEGSGAVLDRLVLAPTDVLLGSALLDASAREILARAKHQNYLIQQRRRGDTEATNASLRPWEELPDALKQANRDYADGIAEALGRLGAGLKPLTGVGPAAGLRLPPGELDRLAKLEHDRWVRDKELDGWARTDGEKDPEQKLHPLMVPWEQLDEPEREKDRDGIRELPTMLAEVGYAIELDDTEQ